MTKTRKTTAFTTPDEVMAHIKGDRSISAKQSTRISHLLSVIDLDTASSSFNPHGYNKSQLDILLPYLEGDEKIFKTACRLAKKLHNSGLFDFDNLRNLSSFLSTNLEYLESLLDIGVFRRSNAKEMPREMKQVMIDACLKYEEINNPQQLFKFYTLLPDKSEFESFINWVIRKIKYNNNTSFADFITQLDNMLDEYDHATDYGPTHKTQFVENFITAYPQHEIVCSAFFSLDLNEEDEFKNFNRTLKKLNNSGLLIGEENQPNFKNLAKLIKPNPDYLNKILDLPVLKSSGLDEMDQSVKQSLIQACLHYQKNEHFAPKDLYELYAFLSRSNYFKTPLVPGSSEEIKTGQLIEKLSKEPGAISIFIDEVVEKSREMRRAGEKFTVSDLVDTYPYEPPLARQEVLTDATGQFSEQTKIAAFFMLYQDELKKSASSPMLNRILSEIYPKELGERLKGILNKMGGYYFLTDDKKDKSMSLGFEIEYANVDEEYEDLIKDVMECFQHGWEHPGDQSVEVMGNDDYGGEATSPVVYNNEDLKRAMLNLAFLQAMNAKTNVSCGLHIHIGVKNLTTPEKFQEIDKEIPEEISKYSYKNYKISYTAYQLEFMKQFIMIYKREESKFNPVVREPNKYTQGIKFEPEALKEIRLLSQLMDQINTDGTGTSRYFEINLQAFMDHGTLEVRRFAGTTEEAQTYATIALISSMAEEARTRTDAVFSRELYKSTHDPKAIISETNLGFFKSKTTENRNELFRLRVNTLQESQLDAVDYLDAHTIRYKLINNGNAVSTTIPFEDVVILEKLKRNASLSEKERNKILIEIKRHPIEIGDLHTVAYHEKHKISYELLNKGQKTSGTIPFQDDAIMNKLIRNAALSAEEKNAVLSEIKKHLRENVHLSHIVGKMKEVLEPTNTNQKLKN